MRKKSETDLLLIGLVWLAGLGAAAQFGKIAVALNAFRMRYDVSEVALGLLISCVGSVGLLFGVLGGAILGRVGIRRAMVWGLLASGVLSLLQSPLPDFALMIALRVLEGAAHLSIVIAGPILMARHSSLRARPAVMALWSSFFGLSYMLVAMAAPGLIATLGLGGYIASHGLYMLILAAALAYALPPAVVPAERAPHEQAPHVPLALHRLPALHLRIYRSPWLSAAALGFVCYTVLYIALLTYLPQFAPAAERTTLSASMPLVSIITSLTLGIWLLRYVQAVTAVQIGFALVALCAVSLLPTLHTGLFVWAALATLAATGFVPGASFSALADLTDTDTDRALATGALAQMGNVGTTLGPPLLAAILAGFGMAGVTAFIWIFCALGIWIHWLQARRRGSI